jgi:NADPH2:quinone reductase
MMQAAIYRRRGAAHDVLELADVATPTPGPGEVRVRLAASAINPSDIKGRQGRSSGQGGAEQGLPWPFQIPHQDGAGTIDAVGDGVDPDRVGRPAWVYHAADDRPDGTAAQWVCLPAAQVVDLPPDVPLAQAAALGIPYMTAHRCLFADGPIAGRTVLVTGGAGAVGNAAVQLARWAGARTVATVSSDEKAAIARAAGADAVVDYTAADARERLAAAAPDGVDRVVDVALTVNLPDYEALLSDHAVVSAYAEIDGRIGEAWPPPMRLRVRNITLRMVRAYGLTQAMLDAATTDITAALRDGALRPLPALHFPLADIADAHAAVEAGAIGKVIVDIP